MKTKTKTYIRKNMNSQKNNANNCILLNDEQMTFVNHLYNNPAKPSIELIELFK